MIVQKEVNFSASPAQVWDLLTNPAMTKQYMFGCEVLSDWNVGSSVIWQGTTEDGKAIVYVKGKVTEFQNGEKVSITMFDPNMGLEDIPENYINLTYALTPTETGTQLVLTQWDFSKVANGQKRYEETDKGWEMIIPIMKQLIEG